jgi:hypothetical protein
MSNIELSLEPKETLTEKELFTRFKQLFLESFMLSSDIASLSKEALENYDPTVLQRIKRAARLAAQEKLSETLVENREFERLCEGFGE